VQHNDESEPEPTEAEMKALFAAYKKEYYERARRGEFVAVRRHQKPLAAPSSQSIMEKLEELNFESLAPQ
jgi:hypothetical protein